MAAQHRIKPNQHMKNSLNLVAAALNSLERLNLTVLEIDLNHAMPRIGVQAGKGCHDLKGTTSCYTQKAGQRMVE
ncbi:hypothetical protein BTA35_0217555, partial [Oceanospirillum linum]